MSRLQVLTSPQRKKYDDVPKLTAQQRKDYFMLSGDDLNQYVDNVRNSTNKVGFIIQHGYFRASGKFFTNERFKDEDVKYVCSTC